MKTLIIYYSYTNNTKKLAEKIKNETNYDIFELTPKNPYPEDYNEVVNLGQYEVDNNVRKEIKNVPNISNYDRLIILTPTWWYKPAPVITTYLTDTNFVKKEVIPVMTNAGWPGTVIKDMTEIAQKNGAKVSHAKEFNFNMNKMSTNEIEFTEWINKIK